MMYGIACNQVYFHFSVCSSGSFGSGCSRTCHCADDGPCDPRTGECAEGCADGWTGQACAQAVVDGKNGR